MNEASRDREEFFELLAQLRDGGVIDDACRQRLQALVVEHEDLRWLYIRHLRLATDLRWSFADANRRDIDDAKGATKRSTEPAASRSQAILPLVRTLRDSSKWMALVASVALVMYFVVWRPC